jgi:hypothetical protein
MRALSVGADVEGRVDVTTGVHPCGRMAVPV